MNGTALRRVNEELKEFYSHSDKHPNGWGLALLEPDMTNWEKEPLCANESRYLRERLSEPIMARSVMAHIRYATIGNVEWRNCHPFCGRDRSGRQWVFQHNGTIFDYPPLHPYVNVQQGDTDSERILLYFLDRIDRKMEESGHVLHGLAISALGVSVIGGGAVLAKTFQVGLHPYGISRGGHSVFLRQQFGYGVGIVFRAVAGESRASA